MKEYFQLRIKMLNRHFKDFGVEPILAYPIVILIFTGITTFLYGKLQEYAIFIYCFIAISILSKLGEKKRNDFLKSCFIKRNYFKVRLIENSLLVFPFILYILYQKYFFYAVILYVIALVLSFIIYNATANFTIPTPFSKKPFEFSVGFRNTFYIYPFIYWLTYKSIEVNNFNLGAFSLIALFFMLLNYYSKIEDSYYVWIYKKSSKDFIVNKIKIGITYGIILSLPICIALSVFFNTYILIIFSFQLGGLFYLAQAIVAKYSIFPEEVNIPIRILIVMSMFFPPFILITLPYFYSKSIEKLNAVLND